MLRTALLFSATALIASAGNVLAEGRTTQIEPRPTYGATVTIEEGVRVFRPLPGNRHVIVNPNRTPLALDLGEDSVTNQNSTATSVVTGRRRY